MYSNHTCPRCAHQIPFERMLGQVVVCECGWSGDKSIFDGPKRKIPIKKMAMGLAALGLIYTGMQAHKWGKHFPERMYYSTLSSLKATTAKDEARMGFVCKEMGKHACAADSYSKALRKSPKSYNIAGALAIELVEVKNYDRAILTFQNFFSHEDGDDIHKMNFAKALSEKDYTQDATEWYYKALQSNSQNFDAAKDLIQHLVKNENYVEALSVIGHYNTLFPKTIKGWAKMTDEVKAKYSTYNSQYAVKEIKISGLNKFLHAPVQFGNNSETKLFLVDPDSEYLTVDMKQLQEMNVDFKDLGEKEVMATNGRYLKGRELVLSELKVGPFQLKNVKAMGCENCAFLLGKDVMKQLNFTSQENKGVKYITLKQ